MEETDSKGKRKRQRQSEEGGDQHQNQRTKFKVSFFFFFLRTRNTAEELKTEVLLSDDGEPKKWFILTVDVLAGRYYIIANCRCIGIGSREEGVETSYCHFMSFDVT